MDIPSDAGPLWEAYFEMLPPEDLPWHQLLGYAQWIQSDLRTDLEARERGLPGSAAFKGPLADEIHRAARRWRLLWQIDSDKRAGFMWGDAGHVYFFIADEDLRSARFDRAWVTGDCY